MRSGRGNELAVTADGPHARDPDEWSNAPLEMCCVCQGARANCALSCRCTAPCICSGCAGDVGACPNCGEAAIPRLPLAPFRRGNVASLQPACAWSPIKLLVTTLTGKKLTVRVPRNHTVGALKVECSNLTSVPPDQWRLLFAGNELDDRLTLSFYNLQKESAIRAVLGYARYRTSEAK